MKGMERMRQTNEILRKASAYFDGVGAPSRRHRSVPFCDDPTKERASMGKATIIGIDLAKRVFQVHGAAADASVLFRKKLSRDRLMLFLSS